VDGITLILVVVAAPAIAGLGVSFLVAPGRTSRALHEWYIVPPAIQPGHRIGLLLGRMVGAGLIALAIDLAIHVTHLLVALQ
jgi:hypothetical protein